MSAPAPSPHIRELIATRRALLGGLAGLPLLNLADAAATTGAAAATAFTRVAATNADAVTLPPGYSFRVLAAWGDPLFEGMPAFDPDTLAREDQERRFGQNNDMIAFFPVGGSFPWPADSDRAILCVNHEYADPTLMFPALTAPDQFTETHARATLAAVGVAVVTIARESGHWRLVRDAAPASGFNRRITPFSPVVFSGPAANHRWIGAASAFVNAHERPAPHEQTHESAVFCGTAANCAGGQTPWGTYLSAEENFQSLFRASDSRAPALRAASEENAFVLDCANFGTPSYVPPPAWPAQFDMSQNPYGPALYGWTVEIDPYDPSWTPRKRTALGRRRAECASTVLSRNGRAVVYSGDDQIDEYLYKFVSRGRFDPADRTANREILDDGQLYAARFNEDGGGEWIALTLRAANAAARRQGYRAPFADAGDLVLRAREAARLLGATPMDRPEDVEALKNADWVGSGAVLVTCTNNREQGFAHPGKPARESATPNRAQSNLAGHILRLDEDGRDCGSRRFRWSIFAVCGDPAATETPVRTRDGAVALVSTRLDEQATITGDRFACPDNICVDRKGTVWIATDGSDALFADCNDSLLAAPASAEGAKPVKRFLVGPVGAEICGPTLAPDERALFVAIQHPGEGDVAGVSAFDLRWRQGRPPPSNFPDGGASWPRSAVVVITRDDGGEIGD